MVIVACGFTGRYFLHKLKRLRRSDLILLAKVME